MIDLSTNSLIFSFFFSQKKKKIDVLYWKAKQKHEKNAIKNKQENKCLNKPFN